MTTRRDDASDSPDLSASLLHRRPQEEVASHGSPRQQNALFLALVLIIAASPLLAQATQTSVPSRHFQASVTSNQIIAHQGQDESLQRVAVTIWGSLRDPAFFHTMSIQLDEDPELEFVVVSRNPGSGPYYRLQIVASREAGILTYSYPSCGRPKAEGTRIALGQCPSGGAAGTAVPTFRWYRFTDHGLVEETR